MTPSDLDVVPTAPFGALVRGIDLREPPAPAVRDELRRLLAEHQVLFWRDQDLSAEQQVAFAETFGPRLSFASVVDTAAGRSGVHEVRGSTVGWHIDASSLLEPPVATVLRAVEVPATGGDTVWASGVAAHDALPEPVRRRLDGRYVTHSPIPADGADPVVAHRLVRTHPETGRRHLYVNLAPWVDARIIGLDEDDSAALVETIRAVYLHPDRQLRFHWTPGALAMWDNRVVQHTGTRDYGDQPRRMTRTCIAYFTAVPAASTAAVSATTASSQNTGG